ncbi:hypothetical protein ACNOYE_33360 [Nannocystaceae bacterium ST9]
MHRREVPLRSPCTESFAAMDSLDERRRWCPSCAHEVHDLSAMNEPEARALLREAVERRVCVRFAVDGEGRVRFGEAPLAAARLTRRPRVTRFALAAVVSLVLLGGCARPIAATAEPAESSDPWLVSVDFEIDPEPEPDSKVLIGAVVIETVERFVDPLVYEFDDEIIPESISRHGRPR